MVLKLLYGGFCFSRAVASKPVPDSGCIHQHKGSAGKQCVGIIKHNQAWHQDEMTEGAGRNSRWGGIYLFIHKIKSINLHTDYSRIRLYNLNVRSLFQNEISLFTKALAANANRTCY